MNTSDDIKAGSKVEILFPRYLAGQVGIVLGREELAEAQESDRWLVQLERDQDITVSLLPSEFRVVTA